MTTRRNNCFDWNNWIMTRAPAGRTKQQPQLQRARQQQRGQAAAESILGPGLGPMRHVRLAATGNRNKSEENKEDRQRERKTNSRDGRISLCLCDIIVVLSCVLVLVLVLVSIVEFGPLLFEPTRAVAPRGCILLLSSKALILLLPVLLYFFWSGN